MGYQTTHRIRFDPWPCEDKTPAGLENFVNSLELDQGWSTWVTGFSGSLPWSLLQEDSSKWYESKDEIIELSKQYPNCTIVLYGVGEDPDDEWVLYARNGRSAKYSREQWTLPLLNEDDLD